MNARRAELVRTYIEAHGLAALTITDHRGRARVDVADKIHWKRPPAAIYWHARADQLRAIADGLPREKDFDDTVRLIELAFERNRIRLTPHALLMQRAEGAINLIELRLASLKADGQLRAMHVEYQDLRLRNNETGRKTPPFVAWVQKKKIDMVRAVAAAAKSA